MKRRLRLILPKSHGNAWSPCWRQRICQKRPLTCRSDATACQRFSPCGVVDAASCLLPHAFPARGTVASSFRTWPCEGVWDQIVRTLREPSAQRSPPCGSWSRQGRRRGDTHRGRPPHAPGETQGTLCKVTVTGAETSDHAGPGRPPRRRPVPSVGTCDGGMDHAGDHGPPFPHAACSCPKAKRGTGRSSSLQACVPCPADGSVAITRGFPAAVRR